MKKKLFRIILGVAIMAVSCDVYHPDNGYLDGLWQLAQADTLSTGGHADLRSRSVTWSFQDKLLQIRNIPDVAPHHLIFHFLINNDELVLFDPHIDNRSSGDIAITDPSVLHEAGIYSLEEHYQVIQLGGGSMTLQSPNLRLYFRKY